MPCRARTAGVAAALLLVAGVGPAGAEQYLGRTVTDVRVEVAGVPLIDPSVVDLIETRIGEALSMVNVRSTIAHLVGLGRFEDVRVFAAPADQGVSVRWLLMPVRRIGAIEIDGDPVVPVQSIRTELADRFGVLPSATRLTDIVASVEGFFADRGFRRASVLPRLQEEESRPERVTLVLVVSAGARASIRSVTVATTPLMPEGEVRQRLALQAGRPFDRVASRPALPRAKRISASVVTTKPGCDSLTTSPEMAPPSMFKSKWSRARTCGWCSRAIRW